MKANARNRLPGQDLSAIGSVEMKPAATLPATWPPPSQAGPGTNSSRPPAGVIFRSEDHPSGFELFCRNIAGEGVLSSTARQCARRHEHRAQPMATTSTCASLACLPSARVASSNNVRADGCQYFTTVLGPGYNYDHRTPFPFRHQEPQERLSRLSLVKAKGPERRRVER